MGHVLRNQSEVFGLVLSIVGLENRVKIITLNIMTLNIMTLNIMTLNIIKTINTVSATYITIISVTVTVSVISSVTFRVRIMKNVVCTSVKPCCSFLAIRPLTGVWAT